MFYYVVIVTIYMNIVLVAKSQIANKDDTNEMFPDWQIFYKPLDILPTSAITKNVSNCICKETIFEMFCSGNDCKSVPRFFVGAKTFFKLQLSSVEVIKKNDFINFCNITAMEIESNANLYKIEPGAFKNMNKLCNLTITSNPKLKYLDHNVFEGLINMEILCMSKNGFIRLSDITLACSPTYLPKIKVLFLTENKFNVIKYNDFHAMNGTALEQLNLIHCEIGSINPNCLYPLKKLKILRICRNFFNATTLTKLVKKTIKLGIALYKLNLYDVGLRINSPYKMLEALGPTNLAFLVLAGNNFNVIYDNWFPKMPHLLTLDMRDCQIMEIHDKAFKPLSNLQNLLLTSNKLMSIPYAIPNPIYLDISKNDPLSTKFIPEDIFVRMSKMQMLRLSHNNIVFLRKTTFYGLKNLKNLILKDAALVSIEDGTFSHMPGLSYLELTNNPGLLSITAGTFLGIPNLHVLLLGGCHIQNLTSTPSIFSNTRNLEHICLEQNSLYAILPNQLTFLNHLYQLEIYENKLHEWNTRILPDSSNLTIVNANDNSFAYITKAMAEDFKTVEKLHLKDNPFYCDCQWQDLVTWWKENNFSVNNAEDVDFGSCINPVKWRGATINKYVDYLINNSSTECLFNAQGISFLLILFLLVALVTIVIYWYRWYISYWIFRYKTNLRKHHLWKLWTKKESKIEYNYDLFVSYSKDDQAWVQKLVQNLEPDIRLCIFERDFPPGATISQSIQKGVLTSCRMLLVVSEAFVRSHWCRWETQLAEFHHLFLQSDSSINLNDKLLIVKLETVPSKLLTPILRYLMKTRIYLEWPNDSDQQLHFWEKLRSILLLSKSKY